MAFKPNRLRKPTSLERFALQLTVAVAIAALVPLGAGAGGVIEGGSFFHLSGGVSADSHVRYLSGLLLGIGLMFFTSVVGIEKHSARFQILGSIVVLGGMARLMTVIDSGTPRAAVILSLVMELGVTPMLCAWQARIASIQR